MFLLRPGALLVGLWLLLGAGAAGAEPPPPRPLVAADRDGPAKQAMSLHDEAWALYEQGHYSAAIEKLEAALRMDPNGKELVYNLALLQEKLANLRAAEGYYRRYLEMETDPRARARVQGVVRRIEGAQHNSRGGAAPAAEPVVGPVRVALPASPAPPVPRPVRPWVIATSSVAAVAFLTGGVFGLAALARNPGAHASTRAGVSFDDLQADARRAHAYAVVADVSFLLTAAATGTAAFLYFSTARAARPDQPAAPARVAVGPGLLRMAF